MSSASLHALIDLRPGEAYALVSQSGSWGLVWREFLDAATFYPALQADLLAGPVSALVVAIFRLWILRRRGQILGAGKLHPRAVESACGYLAAGFVSFAAVLLLGRGGQEVAGGGESLLIAVFSLAAGAVLHGGALGLLSLLCADVVLALPLDLRSIARRWLELLPSFALLMAVALAPRMVFDQMLPGWELDRDAPFQGLLGVLWLITRLAWVGVLLVWLPLALRRRGLREAGRALSSIQWRALGMASARTIVPLAPMLLGLTVLRTLAPATSILPGALTVLASWAIGLAVLGAAMEVWKQANSE